MSAALAPADAAAFAACIEAGVWPVAHHALDPALGVALAERAPTNLQHILVNAIGFGGGHAALLLKDCGAPSA